MTKNQKCWAEKAYVPGQPCNGALLEGCNIPKCKEFSTFCAGKLSQADDKGGMPPFERTHAFQTDPVSFTTTSLLIAFFLLGSIITSKHWDLQSALFLGCRQSHHIPKLPNDISRSSGSSESNESYDRYDFTQLIIIIKYLSVSIKYRKYLFYPNLFNISNVSNIINKN